MSRSGHNSIIAWIRENLLNPKTRVYNIEEANIIKGICHNATLQVPVLRDPYNWFASWIIAGRKWKGDGKLKKEADHLVSRWKALAQEILGETDYLGTDVIPILYNKWVRSPQYRRKLAIRLGMGDQDKGAFHVSPAGGGSSWDGLTFREKANEMAVFDRWQHLEKDSLYQKFMLDSELEDLSIRLFGMPCPFTV